MFVKMIQPLGKRERLKVMQLVYTLGVFEQKGS